jgi:hypothetical protein
MKTCYDADGKYLQKWNCANFEAKLSLRDCRTFSIVIAIPQFQLPLHNNGCLPVAAQECSYLLLRMLCWLASCSVIVLWIGALLLGY